MVILIVKSVKLSSQSIALRVSVHNTIIYMYQNTKIILEVENKFKKLIPCYITYEIIDAFNSNMGL